MLLILEYFTISIIDFVYITKIASSVNYFYFSHSKLYYFFVKYIYLLGSRFTKLFVPLNEQMSVFRRVNTRTWFTDPGKGKCCSCKYFLIAWKFDQCGGISFRWVLAVARWVHKHILVTSINLQVCRWSHIFCVLGFHLYMCNPRNL